MDAIRKLLKRIFNKINKMKTACFSNNEKSEFSPEILKLVDNINKLVSGNGKNLNPLLFGDLNDELSDNDRYQYAEAISMAIYPKYKFSEYGRIYLEDEEFIKYYKNIMDKENWHSMDRKYTLNQLLKLCNHLDGDLAECGTYKGASAYLMCKKINGTGKSVHLFDSFEGLSEPDSIDGNYWSKGSLKSDAQDVINILDEFNNYRIHKGWIPERFDEVSDLLFSFLHIDVDLYDPTLESLKFFYTRIVSGGMILLDDYGFTTCPGAKSAADNFFDDKPEEIILLPTGQAFIVKL